jgi:aspartyl-tRNA(Asn)/glutamyl-tRNA(Gln) amidotransferase subunit C
MKISRDEVQNVAKLARLDLDDAAIDRFAEQIGDILDYVDQLKGVDTAGVEGTAHATALTNAFREDHPHEHLDRDAALGNAPEHSESAFIVPKVIE